MHRVGIVRSRTKGHGVCFCLFVYASSPGVVTRNELYLEDSMSVLEY
jgi:hypothetical protein